MSGRIDREDGELLLVLAEAADAVHAALARVGDLRRGGRRPGQYGLDLVADEAACAVLHREGLAVLSEESGLSGPDGAPLVIVDPVDGSTNASAGLPWYATSLCVLDATGPRVSLVVNQASGTRYEAVRGSGARRDGKPISPSPCTALADSVVGVSGLPASDPGWAQFRALGAAALDLCAVAEGALDGFRVAGGSTLHVWDYVGGLLVCTEAGAAVGECDGRDPVIRDGSARRPVAAACAGLRDQLAAADV